MTYPDDDAVGILATASDDQIRAWRADAAAQRLRLTMIIRRYDDEIAQREESRAAVPLDAKVGDGAPPRSGGNRMKKISAVWDVSLLVTCPECDALVDLTDSQEFWSGRMAGLSPGEIRAGVDMKCPECDAAFDVDIIG